MTNQPPYQHPQHPHEPQEYAPPEDPFTEPPTPPPYADATHDASYIQQSHHLPAPQPYPSQQFQVPQQYQPAPPFTPPAPPFNPAFVAPPALQQRPRPVWPWVLTGAAVLVVALVVGAIALTPSSSDDTTGTTNDVTDVTDPTPTTQADGQMGQPALDGKLAFTVKSMKCGQTQIGKPSGDYDFTRKAQHQFCIINLNVKNTGRDSLSFSSFGFKTTSKSGASVTEDLLAEDTAASDDGKTFSMFWTLSASEDVDIKLIYDTPPASQPAAILVRQSITGTGIKIPLTAGK